MTSKQIRWVLERNSTLPAVSTRGIKVVEWRVPDGQRQDIAIVQGQYERLPWQFQGVDSYGPARPYSHAVDGMAIYKGVQL